MIYEKTFLKYCIYYFGQDKQHVVCIEEMAELTQQISKFIIGHDNKSRENLIEELTDVLIMLDQLKIIHDITEDEIKKVRDFKIERLHGYITKKNIGDVE